MRTQLFIAAFAAVICGYAQTFSEFAITDLTTLPTGDVRWVDINNDNRLDFTLLGKDALGNDYFRIFTNNGDNTFSNSTAGVTTVADAYICFGDLNNDGYVDLFLNGTSSGNPSSTIYLNQKNNTFSALSASNLLALDDGSAAIADFDNDGDMDIIQTGRNASNTRVLQFYENEALTLTLQSTSVAAISDGLVLAEDINQDGFVDIFISGVDSDGNRIARFYTNDGAWGFTLSSNVLTGISVTSADFADLDNNGFPDLVTTGLSDGGALTTSYLNTNGIFTATNFGFTNLYNGEVRLGDISGDGLTDVWMTGVEDDGDLHTRYYRRDNPALTFTQVAITVPNAFQGGVDLGDFDNDNDLDVFYHGTSETFNFTRLYQSSGATANTIPTVPTGLASDVSEDTVSLSWTDATDTQSSSSALKYNVFMRNLTTSDSILNPLANITSGSTLLPFDANNSWRNAKTVRELPEGNYQWSVQSIDPTGGVSAFSATSAFTVCYAIDVGADQTVCNGDNVTLQIGSGTDVVNWVSKRDGTVATNTFTYTFSVTQRDTIIAELTKPAIGCTVRDTVIVDIYPLPTVDLGTELFGCFGTSTTLSVTGYDSVNWHSTVNGELQRNSFTLNYTFNTRDTVVAEVYSDQRCLTRDSLIIRVRDLPTPDLGADQEVCDGLTTTLTLSGFSDVDWYTRSEGLVLADNASYTYPSNGTDSVVAVVQDAFGCVNSDTLRIVTNPLPSFSLGADQEVCFMESTTLSITGFANVNWSSKTDGSLATSQDNLTYQVLKTDTLIARVTDSKTCINYDSVIIKRLDLPVFTIGKDTALCAGSQITLNSDVGLARTDWYEIEPADTTLIRANSFFYTHKPTEADQILAVVKDNNGCVNSDSIQIDYNTLPVISLGADQALCIGDSTTLTIGSWSKIEWFSVASGTLSETGSSLLVVPSTSDTIRVTVTDTNSCVNKDTINIKVNALPTPNLGADTIICFADVFSRTLSGYSSVEWKDLSGTQLSTNATYSFTASDDRSVAAQVVDSNGCTNGDTIAVDVKALPSFSLGADQVVCIGDTATITVNTSDHDSVRWVSANTGNLSFSTLSIGYLTSTSDNIYATLVSSFGCQDSDTVAINIQALPNTNAGADQLICLETGVSLGVENNSSLTYLWSPERGLNATNIGQPSASPDTTTTYFLTVVDAFGCTDKDTVLVEVNPATIIDLGGDRAICIGESTTLGADTVARGSVFEYNYSWSPSPFLDNAFASNPTATVTETTRFTLSVNTGDCEADTASVLVTVNPLPVVTAPADLTVGFGESAMLVASGGVEYEWVPEEGLDNSLVANPVAGPQETTTYEVFAADENGCVSSDTVVVFVDNKVFIPSLFTPNGDGRNDLFRVFSDGIMEINFVVYDRSGSIVYQTTSVEQAENVGWDGTYKGQPLKIGSYLWSLSGKYFDGSPISFGGKNTGTIKLLR